MIRSLTFPIVKLSAGEATRLVVITAQLGLVLFAAHLFQVQEAYGFGKILPLIFVGFVIHALLSAQYRLPFFLLLSLCAIGMILGYRHGLGLIVIGFGLIAICHVPIAFSIRVALLVVAGVVLAALRAGWILTHWLWAPAIVLPILGSMFMFRLIIYMYDLRHEKKPASLWERLSYFFLLPNACFPLFPVVDYQTYRRTYYDGDAFEVYQKGVFWMLRGLTHLLLYRLVYLHLIPSTAEVHGLGGVLQSIVSTYLLYLQISGQFHLIIGILCLFGFNLPETHHRYLLAFSFNDYWRRINIYWKDFMMKIFYYPAFMGLRQRGMTTGLVLATFTVFFGTWLLHSYQWFWLQGSFPLNATDALFWGILGMFVVINSIYEAKRGRKCTLSPVAWSFRREFLHSAKVVGMFVIIAILWSLWSSPTVGEWWSLMSAAGESGIGAYMVLFSLLLALLGIGMAVQYGTYRGWSFFFANNRCSFLTSATFTTGTVALLLVLAGLPQLNSRVGGRVQELLTSIQRETLNWRDARLLERGYYEGLLDETKYTALRTVHRQKPEGWGGIRFSNATHETGDIPEYELVPLYRGTFKKAPLRTNKWGMRDQDYTKEKPVQTYRIALIGASYEMGTGVSDDETFESIAEERLNKSATANPYTRYEILNFAVEAYGLVQNVAVAEKKVFQFEPDAVWYASHLNDGQWVVTTLGRMIEEKVPIPYPQLQDVIRRAGVSSRQPRSKIESKLWPYEEEIIQWCYRRFADLAREYKALPVWLYVPLTEEVIDEVINAKRTAQLSRLAQRAGLTIWNLGNVYAGHDPAAIQVAPWDMHPNAKGHQLLAEHLYEILRINEYVHLRERAQQATVKPVLQR